MKEGRKTEYPEKTPGNELQKMPHTEWEMGLLLGLPGCLNILQNLSVWKIGTLVATLPNAWHSMGSARTGWPRVSAV